MITTTTTTMDDFSDARRSHMGLPLLVRRNNGRLGRPSMYLYHETKKHKSWLMHNTFFSTCGFCVSPARAWPYGPALHRGAPSQRLERKILTSNARQQLSRLWQVRTSRSKACMEFRISPMSSMTPTPPNLLRCVQSSDYCHGCTKRPHVSTLTFGFPPLGPPPAAVQIDVSLQPSRLMSPRRSRMMLANSPIPLCPRAAPLPLPPRHQTPLPPCRPQPLSLSHRPHQPPPTAAGAPGATAPAPSTSCPTSHRAPARAPPARLRRQRACRIDMPLLFCLPGRETGAGDGGRTGGGRRGLIIHVSL